MLNLLLDHVLVVKPLDRLLLSLLATAWVSLADDFADHIDLWLKLVDGLLTIL